MSEIFTLTSIVSYWDVDRDQRMTLGGIFKLLQEAAIKHADVYGLGAKAMVAHGESWVLNRMSAEIRRYPLYEEPLKVATWSAGIRGFRGYRDLRVYCGDELVMSASSLWLYINLQHKTLIRVPEELAVRFPVGQAEVFRPDLEKRKYTPPVREAPAHAVTLRYSDFDGNSHLNNTAYFDCLQTGLARAGLPPRPRELDIQFVKEVPLTVPTVSVAIEARGTGAAFAISSGTDLHAQGGVTV